MVAPTIGRIIGAYKSYISCERRKLSYFPITEKIWQRGFYDHIIRNDNDLNETREYIQNNPLAYLEKQRTEGDE